MAVSATLYNTLPAGEEWAVQASNGSAICVLGSDTTRCMRSTDGGATWVEQVMPFVGTWRAMAWNGSVFCALAIESANCATSTDGITWTSRSMPASLDWSAIAWDGSVFVALSLYSTSGATSPDGTTWTARTLPSSQAWSAVKSNGTNLVAVAENTASAAYSTNHGTSWSAVSLPASSARWSLVAAGTKFLVLGVAAVYVSTTNGTSWTTLSGSPLPLDMKAAVAQTDSTRILALAADGSYALSTDTGATWTTGASLYVEDASALISIGRSFYVVETYGTHYIKVTASVVVVVGSGASTLPLIVSTIRFGSAALPLSVSVVPLEILSGAQSVCIGIGAASKWTVVVSLDGTDVSALVDSEISVEAEEGAARIAEFNLRPLPGTVLSLTEWTGRAVTIDVADNSTGTPRYPMRLFTGVVDTSSLNHASGVVAMRCTDDLQGRCQAMSNAALLAIIGGYDSPAVFDSAASGWNYAQDRLSTVAASLDISPEGALRLTPWEPKVTADLVLGENLIGEQSLNPQVANRSSLTNEVLVSFDYRFPRVKAETYRVDFSYVNLTNFAAHILAGNWWLQRKQVTAAIEAAGGHVESVTYEPLPTWIIAVGAGFFTPSAADLDLCMGFAASVSFDYAQTTEEQHQIRVRNEKSIDLIGLRQTTITGALEGAYPDLSAAETSIKLFKEKSTSIPPTDMAPVLFENTTSVNATLTAETNRAAANAAMEALIAVGKTRIWASHRNNSLSATVPLMPALDVNKTIEVNADGVAAKGKCSRATHRLSTTSGSATSEFTIALCSVAGDGITHDDDAIAAPAGTSTSPTPLTGPVDATFNMGIAEDHVLTVTFPGVEEAERANAIRPLPSTVAAGLVEDLFTVTL